MGQHDGSINMIANGERIAEPCDINELILEISLFTKIWRLFENIVVFFLLKVYREFFQAVATANTVELACDCVTKSHFFYSRFTNNKLCVSFMNIFIWKYCWLTWTCIISMSFIFLTANVHLVCNFNHYKFSCFLFSIKIHRIILTY